MPYIHTYYIFKPLIEGTALMPYIHIYYIFKPLIEGTAEKAQVKRLFKET